MLPNTPSFNFFLFFFPTAKKHLKMDATRKRFHHLQRRPPKHDLFIIFFFFFFPNAKKHLKMDATRRRFHHLQRRGPITTSPKPEVPAQRFKPGPPAATAMTNHVPGSFFFFFLLPLLSSLF
jgi:hypothetical protein